MEKTRIADCNFQLLKNFNDFKGGLDVIEGIKGINNEILQFNRAYILRNFTDHIRGVHAHKNLYQLFLTFNGKFTLKIYDGFISKEIKLKDNSAFLVVPGIWRELKDFSNETIIVVLASELYDPHDYIHDIEEFRSYKELK